MRAPAPDPGAPRPSSLGVLRTVAGAGATAAGLWLWWWGIAHWPAPPDAYGAGFQAWAAGLVLIAAAWMPGGWRLPRCRRTGWLALGLFAVAAALRLYRVDTVPFEVHFDETNGFAVIEAMLDGRAENAFSRMDYPTANPGVLLLLQWALGFVCRNLFSAHRHAAAIWGTLSVVATYALARRLYSRGVAFAAASVLTVSCWSVVHSRFFPFTVSAAFAATAVWFFVVRACERQRLFDGIVAGIVTGLCLLLYDPVKVLFAALPAWWLCSAVLTPGFGRRTLPVMVVIVAAAALVLTPLLRRNGWEKYLERAGRVTVIGAEFRERVEGSGEWSGDWLARQGERLGRVATGGAELAANHYTDDPLLNPIELGTAALGLALCIRRRRSWKHTIAPIWLALTAVGVTLSSVPEASYRLGVALPALAVLSGSGLCAMLKWLRRRVPSRHAALAMAAAALVVLGADAYINGTRTLAYFARMRLAGERATLGRAIAAAAPEAVYYVEDAPVSTSHPVFRAFTHRRTLVDVPNLLDDVPRVVDRGRPAVFVVPYWHPNSLEYLRAVYPRGRRRTIADPSGFVAGHTVAVPPGTAPVRQPADEGRCGLRRVRCDGAPGGIDAALEFLDLRRLCREGGTTRIEWRGAIDLGNPPATEVGIMQTYVSTSVRFDGAWILTDVTVPHQPFPLCPAPGIHEIEVSTVPSDGAPTTLSLWWARTGKGAGTVPCEALRPAAPAGPGVRGVEG